MNIKFVLIKSAYCPDCRKIVMHECGMDLDTKKLYKQCINCNKLTKVSEAK